jgi:hypothetical protein
MRWEKKGAGPVVMGNTFVLEKNKHCTKNMRVESVAAL